jgi:invasion protein IalB
MKVSKITFAAFSALAFSAFATTASAYAASSVDANAAGYNVEQSHQWTPSQNAPQSKTRAEVRQELVEAQKDGQLAALNRFYQGS